MPGDRGFSFLLDQAFRLILLYNDEDNLSAILKIKYLHNQMLGVLYGHHINTFQVKHL